MKTRFVLCMAATLAFLALPVYAQHGGGHGGGPPSGVGMGSSHSSASSSDSHGNSSDAHGNSGKTSTGSGPKSVSERLSDNTKLSSKLASLLPACGQAVGAEIADFRVTPLSVDHSHPRAVHAANTDIIIGTLTVKCPHP